jgi:hypothetical protein
MNGFVLFLILLIKILLSDISSIAQNPKKFSAAIFQKLILNPLMNISSSVFEIDAKQLNTSISF